MDGRGSHLRFCRIAPGRAVLVRRAATFVNRNGTPESRVPFQNLQTVPRSQEKTGGEAEICHGYDDKIKELCL
jgi:hypothetical protein